MHACEPFSAVQEAPHAPQSLVVVSGVSQPGAPVQSPHPAPHASSVQVPDAQVSEALGRSQPTPQPPQSSSVVVDVSQPFAAFPSQLAQPVPQVALHAPPEQVFALLTSAQVTPQPPQFPSETLVLVSQPLAGLPSQSPKPGLHVGSHVPPTHALAPLTNAQAVSHEPQVATDARSASQPLAALSSQSAVPGSHTDDEHEPARQLVAASVSVQTRPHAPQSDGVVSGVVQPSAGH